MPRHRAAWRTGFAELEVFVDGRDFPAMADCSRSTALMVNLAFLPSFCCYQANAILSVGNNCIQLDSHLYVVLLQHV